MLMYVTHIMSSTPASSSEVIIRWCMYARLWVWHV